MRVIAGKYRSRRLASLRGLDLRPTSDRLRETLFNVLTAGNPDALHGTTWLDLFAGTGAVGIEALSRGASWVVFVEQSRAAGALIAKNLKALGVNSDFQVLHMSVASSLARLHDPVDYVFLDPPYRMADEYEATLNLLATARILKAGATVIAEHSRKYNPSPAHFGLERYRKLEQGDAALSFYRFSDGDAGLS